MMNKNKYLKIIPLMLLITFLLSGCVSLQDLRDDHAVWKDSTKKTIIWQGKEYHYLTQESESYLDPEYEEIDYIFLTSADVPLLLSSWEGEMVYYSKDSNFLDLYGEIYCIEDKMEEMTKRLKNDEEMNCYGYQYVKYNDEYSMGENVFCFLSDDDIKLLKEIGDNCTKLEDDTELDYYDWIADFYFCSEDLLLKKYWDVYLCKNEEGQYFFEYTEEETNYYFIPEKYYESIEKTFENAIKEWEIWKIELEEADEYYESVYN